VSFPFVTNASPVCRFRSQDQEKDMKYIIQQRQQYTLRAQEQVP